MDHSLDFWIQGNEVNEMSGFSIDFVSDMSHEHLMAEISFNGRRLCILDKENGNDKIEVEFLVDLYVLADAVKMKFSLDEFVKVMELARSDLVKCA